MDSARLTHARSIFNVPGLATLGASIGQTIPPIGRRQFLAALAGARRAAPEAVRLLFINVPHPEMLGKRWCVNSFARFTGGVYVFQTCAIPRTWGTRRPGAATEPRVWFAATSRQAI